MSARIAGRPMLVLVVVMVQNVVVVRAVVMVRTVDVVVR
jgi:hypothetical protein